MFYYYICHFIPYVYIYSSLSTFDSIFLLSIFNWLINFLERLYNSFSCQHCRHAYLTTLGTEALARNKKVGMIQFISRIKGGWFCGDHKGINEKHKTTIRMAKQGIMEKWISSFSIENTLSVSLLS